MKPSLSALAGLGVVLGLSIGAASAATLSSIPESQDVLPGADPVSITLAVDFESDTLGGNLTLNFDPNVLSYNISSTTFFPNWDDFSSVDESQAASGFLAFSFGTLSEQVGTFDLATLSFAATNVAPFPKSTDLLFEVPDGVWSGDVPSEFISVETVNGSVNVVPIPAAAWLFGSALAGLLGFSGLRRGAKESV